MGRLASIAGLLASLMGCVGWGQGEGANGVSDSETGVEAVEPEVPVEECDVDSTWMVLGAGMTTFRPLSAGAEMPLYYGTQAGGRWHLSAGLFVFGGEQEVRLLAEVRHVESSLVLSTVMANHALRPVAQVGWSCLGELLDLHLEVDTEPVCEALGLCGTPPTALCGEEVEIWAQLMDRDGAVLAEALLPVVVQPDEASGMSPCL